MKEFVETFQTFYGKKAMTYNIHLIQHLCDTVENCGLLWAYSYFCFESKNGFLRKKINGSTDIVKQLSFKCLTICKNI
jgi:hypothetical protein